MPRLLLPMCFVMLLAGQALAGPIQYFGTIADPTGDYLNGAVSGPDIISATIAVDATSFFFTALFADGTFDPALSTVLFNLDTDQNAATGVAWRGMGMEYAVSPSLNSDNTLAGVVQFGAGLVGFVPVDLLPNGVSFTVPRSILGNDEGLVNWDVAVQTRLSANGFTQILDWAPNNAPPSAATLAAVPEPATWWFVLLGAPALLYIRHTSKVGNIRL